jgi:hypothetical protein
MVYIKAQALVGLSVKFFGFSQFHLIWAVCYLSDVEAMLSEVKVAYFYDGLKIAQYFTSVLLYFSGPSGSLMPALLRVCNSLVILL